MSQLGTRDYQRLAFGASVNNSRINTRQIERSDVVKAATISFTASDTIADSGSGMGAIGVGDLVEVRGSAANNRRFRPSSAAAGSLTVAPAQVQTASASPTVSLVRVG